MRSLQAGNHLAHQGGVDHGRLVDRAPASVWKLIPRLAIAEDAQRAVDRAGSAAGGLSHAPGGLAGRRAQRQAQAMLGHDVADRA